MLVFFFKIIKPHNLKYLAKSKVLQYFGNMRYNSLAVVMKVTNHTGLCAMPSSPDTL